jgi:phosphatidylglycerol---prolipoprotein diacylglyceryl transferase
MLGWPSIAVWQHTPHPFLIRFSETIGIRYYGLAYLLAFASAAWLLVRYHRAGRSPFGLGTISDLMTYLIAGVLIGGRLGYFLFYQPRTLLAEPLALFRVWEGGMASHGGFIGVIVALWLFARGHKVTLFLVSDLVVSMAPLGLGLGRLANFLNGELWGKVTDVPWAFIFDQTGGGKQPRHPSQLYEAALEGFLLFAIMQWRFWRSETVKLQPGRLSGEFLIGYAMARIVCEAFREPDASLILGLSRGTFYSLFLAIGGLLIIALSRPSQRKS